MRLHSGLQLLYAEEHRVFFRPEKWGGWYVMRRGGWWTWGGGGNLSFRRESRRWKVNRLQKGKSNKGYTRVVKSGNLLTRLQAQYRS